MVTLRTERLLLRMFCADDFDTYAQMCADPEVMRYLGEGKTLSRAEAWRQMAMILGHWQLRGYGLWAVQASTSGELLGRIGFFQPEDWPGFELGWMLGRPHWGRGYATEGARAALRYGFQDLGQAQIISLIRSQNAASIRVAERLGERLQGSAVVAGSEALVYGIGREEWAACRPHP